MNNKEFRTRLSIIEKRCDNLLENIRKDIKETEKIFAEAEKPKLEHGDFGFDKGNPRLFCGENGTMYGESGDPSTCESEMDTKYGNIFDLMKGWDKDLDRASIDGFVIENCGNRIAIGGRRFLIEQAEKFWKKLGHLIISYKRRHSTC